MGCKIIFAPQAITDLAEAVHHIAKDDPETALRVGNALIDRVTILENFPLLGSPYPKRPGVRKLVSRPYIMFYRANPKEPRGHSALLARRTWRAGIGSNSELKSKPGHCR